MFRAFKIFWATLTHKHDWQQLNKCPVRIDKVPVTLERCYCGKERAMAHYPTHSQSVNAAWFREKCKWADIEIPEPQELKK